MGRTISDGPEAVAAPDVVAGVILMSGADRVTSADTLPPVAVLACSIVFVFVLAGGPAPGASGGVDNTGGGGTWMKCCVEDIPGGELTLPVPASDAPVGELGECRFSPCRDTSRPDTRSASRSRIV